MRVFLLMLMVTTLSLFSADKALLDASKVTGYKVQTNVDSYLDVSFTVKDINFDDISTEKGIFTSVTIDNGYTTRVEGSPALPTFRELIAMPYGAEPQVEVISYDSKIYKLSELGIEYPIIPAQPSYSKSSKPEDRKFIYNESAYISSKFTDDKIVSISKSGTMRGVGVGALKVRPFRYNPTEGTIEVLNDLEVRVSFVNADPRSESIKAESYSPYFESSLQTMINYKPSFVKADLMNWPVTYLIVASDALSGNSDLQRFVDWKTEKGFNVLVNYVSASSSIFTNDVWVENQWNTLSPKPSFILLVGDESGTYNVEAQDNPPLGSGGSVTRSDLEYGVIGSTSSANRIPSMYVGRFSVRSTSELTAQVDKTIWYEKEQFTTSADLNYLTYPLGVAGVDASFSASHGDPHISYGWIHYFTSSNGMANADYYLSDTSGYSSTPGNVVSYISNGANFYNYTAHGEQTAFQNPLFSISNIDGLSNTGEYPLVIGNCCLTGSFGTTECFGEAWLNAPNKGAIGYIGASMSTYWDEDLAMGVGIGDTSVQGDVPPTLSINNPGMYDGVMELGYSSQASIKHVGLMAVENYGGTKVDWYWSSYHMFGDPSLQPYFGIPTAQTASHSGSVDSGETSFAVTTTPYAYIAFSDQSNVLHGAAQANSSGYASVSIDPYTNGDTAKLVVTAQFKKPYFEDITVGGGSTPPSTPVTISPVNGSSTTDKTPGFDWNDVSGATTYTIQADNNSGFTSPEISQTTTSSSYTPSSDLTLGTYYWRVKANNTYGSSSYTTSWTVTIEDAIVYTLPFSENFNVSASLPADWEIVDIEGNGQVWQFGTHTSGMTGADGNYAYLNSDGYGSGNSQNADLVSPLINMTGQSNVNLSFNHYFKYYSPSTASLYYSVNGGDTWTIISQWTASTLNPLSFDQEISAVAGYSQVKFKWNFTGTWGYYWDIDDVSITSQSSSPPDTPVLASPSNGSSTLDRTPSFDWSDVSEATSYNIQVDNNSDFASPEINQSVASSNYTPASDLALDTYYWRVNASSSNGSSPYSSSRTITIEAETAYTLPFTEDFNASTSLPTDWTQQNSSGVTDRWSVSVTTNAGGTTNEMKCVYQQINPGTTRLVTPLLDTDGCSSLDLSFKYLLDDYAVGATLLIQSSSDGTNWTNEAWSLATASNNLVGPGTINTTVTNNVGSGTYVAFVITGDLYQFDNWYVDDISITSEAPVISPTATTLAAGSVTTGSASLNGIINANGESTTVSFEYGLTTGYGYTSGGVPSTVTGTTDTSVYANISGLTQNTMYNYRLKAVSAGGTAYGTNMTFTTDQSVSSVDPPTDLSALANGSNVSLSWTAPVGSSPDPDTLSDGFETYANFTLDFTPWTQIDGDGSATYGSNDAAFENENYTGAYIIFNPSAATPALAGNWGAHSGSKYVACFAAQTPSNDDWLISPQLLIGSNYNLNFYAKSVTDQYGLERFKVSISTTGTNTGDFSVISSGSYVEVPISWTNYNYDLSAYEGQEIYIAITCVSNDAFVFMVDDISVNNAKSEIVLKKGFEKGREVLRTPVGKTRYLGIDSPQADFSPPATRDVKSNLTGFKVYRNSNLLATIYNPLDLTYFDAGLTDGSYSYNVTATYNDPVQESNPSNTEYVTISNEYVIDSFPWNESFEKLTFAPDEWEVQSSSANTWAETIGYTIGETTVSPVDGSKFAYVQWHGTDSQDEWLITPPIDLSSIGTPELSFWFNGSYYYSVDPEPNAMLKVMQKVDGGSWTEIWKASDHTDFDADYTNYSWLETILPIGSEGIVQFAFVYQGTDGANFAVDDVTVNGTPKALKNSVVDTGNGLEMHLSWNYVVGATTYHIYRSTDAYNNFERIGSTTSNYFVDDTVDESGSNKHFYYLTADNAK